MSHLSYATSRNEVASPALWQLLQDLYRTTPLFLFLQALKGR